MSLVIFDLDGTLADTRREILAAFQLALHACDLPVSWADRLKIGPPVNEMLRRGFPELDSVTAVRIEQQFRLIYDNSTHELTLPFSGVIRVVEKLRSLGNVLAIATNKPAVPTKTLVCRLFGEQFDRVLSPDSFGGAALSKSEMVREIVTSSRTEWKKVFMIGDAPSDVAAGKANGCETVAVTYGYSSTSDLTAAKPDHIISKIEMLLPIAMVEAK